MNTETIFKKSSHGLYLKFADRFVGCLRFGLLLSSLIFSTCQMSGSVVSHTIDPHFGPTLPPPSSSNWVTYDYWFVAYPSSFSNELDSLIAGDIHVPYASSLVDLKGITMEYASTDPNRLRGAAERHLYHVSVSCNPPNCSDWTDGFQTITSVGGVEQYSPADGASMSYSVCDGGELEVYPLITYTNAGFFWWAKSAVLDSLPNVELWDQIPLVTDINSTNTGGGITILKVWQGASPLFYRHQVFNFTCPDSPGSALNCYGSSGYLHISLIMGPGATSPTNLVGVNWPPNFDDIRGGMVMFLPLPNIESFSPISGPVGTNVVISGHDFSTSTASNIVYFGTVRATVTAATATNLTVTVPSGATYGPISISVDGLTAISATPFVPTFAPSSTNISFTSKTNLATTTPQLGVTIGDINGDGKPDIVTVNSQGTTLTIFTNGSVTGTFFVKSNYSTGNSPYSCALGDMDGDGLPDIIVGNCSDQSVSVYLNHANNPGAFTAAGTFAVAANPTRIAVGDLDRDGRLDLAVSTGDGSGNNGVSILQNASLLGVLSFNSYVAFTTDPSDGSNPWDVKIADLDGDGMPDLATSSYDSGKVFLFRNETTNSAISFSSPTTIDAGTTLSMTLGDFDNDGKADLVVALYSDDLVQVLKNNSSVGSFSFGSPVTFSTGAGPRDVAIGDITGDGLPDLVICNSDTSTVSVLRNKGTATIDSSLFAAHLDFSSGSSPSTAAVGDIDADGRPDLVVSRWGGAGAGTVAVLKNTTAP